MRRKDKQIEDKNEIEAIICEAKILRIALAYDNKPYIVPMCFGYYGNNFFVHGALKGKKIDILQNNPNISFELETDTKIVMEEKPCDCGMRFKSIIGFGKGYILENFDEKKIALDIIMGQYSDKDFEFPEASINSSAVIKIEIENMTGKKSGY
jgi:nitroimidazol reductase NimA-like FMN-containing flavoprotein (pyridoxamine 5'-phosphate oxidase superfamily)